MRVSVSGFLSLPSHPFPSLPGLTATQPPPRIEHSCWPCLGDASATCADLALHTRLAYCATLEAGQRVIAAERVGRWLPAPAHTTHTHTQRG